MAVKIWTYERVKEEAKKYERPSYFKKSSPGAYTAARRNGWMKDVCAHMKKKVRWNKKSAHKAAKQYETRAAFQHGTKGAYLFALRKGFLVEITAHMREVIKPSGFWTKEACAEEAEKYQTRGEFQTHSGSAYMKALNEGWLDDICSHMTLSADGYHHCVYAIYNERTKEAYIGITRQLIKNRIKQHKKINTTKSKKVIELVDSQYKVLTPYNIPADLVKENELQWVNEYKKKGYNVLNNIKQVGKVGASGRVWSDKIIFAEAKKYKTRNEFKTESPKIYDAAVSQRLLEQACSHMRAILPKNTWTKENCLEFARSCKTSNEFRKNQSAYSAVLKNGWLDEINELFLSLEDLPWTRKGCNIRMWSDAQELYELWLENDKCGVWKFRRVSGIKSPSILDKFRLDWVPNEDPYWIEWKEEIQS